MRSGKAVTLGVTGEPMPAGSIEVDNLDGSVECCTGKDDSLWSPLEQDSDSSTLGNSWVAARTDADRMIPSGADNFGSLGLARLFLQSVSLLLSSTLGPLCREPLFDSLFARGRNPRRPVLLDAKTVNYAQISGSVTTAITNHRWRSQRI